MKKRKSYYQYDFADVYGKEWTSNPKRIEDGQLDFEDYYDHTILGEETREEFVHRKMSALPKCRIMRQTIVAGDSVEINIYPCFLNRKDVPRAGKYKESREVQKKLNAKNSQKRLVRLMNANFTKGDLIMTLTYADGFYPTPERAKKDMTNYIKRVRAYRKKQGLPPLKYIYVTESVPEGEQTRKVRIHHHMIINAMDRDTAEKLWKAGRTESKYAQPDDFGLEGFARYITKLSLSKGHHKWVASKNLDKPKEYKSVTHLSRKRFAEIIKAEDKAELMESLYPGRLKYLDSNTYISDEYGGFYLYSRLRRKESVWKKVQTMSERSKEVNKATDKATPTVPKDRKEESKAVAADQKESREEGKIVAAVHEEKKMKCKAYLEYEWKGGIADGQAIYSVLLEVITAKGIPVTRQYIGSLEHMTKNRALLKLAIIAIENLKPCNLELHSNSAYLNIERFFEQKKKEYSGVKNADLIEELLTKAKGFELTTVCEKENEYSKAMKIQRKEYYEKERNNGK